MYDWVSAENSPLESGPVLVAGSGDASVACAVGMLIGRDLVTEVAISGGVGRGTGTVRKAGFPTEADFQKNRIDLISREFRLTQPPIHVGRKANNAFSNAREGLDALGNPSELTVVALGLRLRRIANAVELEATKRARQATRLHRIAGFFNFDADNPEHKKHVAEELLALADWPGHGLLLKEPDLERYDLQELVEFARTKHQPPKPRARLAAAASHLPRGVQLFLARRMS